jgi:hypothetical protein
MTETEKAITFDKLNITSINYHDELQTCLESIKEFVIPAVPQYTQKSSLMSTDQVYLDSLVKFIDELSNAIKTKNKHISQIDAQKNLYFEYLQISEGHIQEISRIIVNAIKNLGIAFLNGLMWLFNLKKRFEYFAEPPNFENLKQSIHEKYGATLQSGEIVGSKIDDQIVAAINNYLSYHDKTIVTKETLLKEGLNCITKNFFNISKTDQENFSKLLNLLKENQPNLDLFQRIALKANQLDIEKLANFEHPDFEFDFTADEITKLRESDEGRQLKQFLESQSGFNAKTIDPKIKMLTCLLDGDYFHIKDYPELSLDSGASIDKTLASIGKNIILAKNDTAQIKSQLDALVIYCFEKKLTTEQFNKIINTFLINQPNYDPKNEESKQFSNLKSNYSAQYSVCLKINYWSGSEDNFIQKIVPTPQKTYNLFQPTDPENLNLHFLSELIMRQNSFKNLAGIQFLIEKDPRVSICKDELLGYLTKLNSFLVTHPGLRGENFPKTVDAKQVYSNVIYGIMNGEELSSIQDLEKIKGTQMYKLANQSSQTLTRR